MRHLVRVPARYPRGVTLTAERATPRNGRARSRVRPRADTPVLVRQVRNGIEESVHRGDIVEADVEGRLIRALGDPERIVTLRSTVKPFGLVALVEAGGVDAFDLEAPEIAIMASSHSGEDFHVRTLQGMFRRAGVSQSLLACGNEGMPLDDCIRLLPTKPSCGESEQHPLRVDQTPGPLEVLAHARRVDPQTLDQPGQPMQREVERDRGIGRDHALDR